MTSLPHTAPRIALVLLLCTLLHACALWQPAPVVTPAADHLAAVQEKLITRSESNSLDYQARDLYSATIVRGRATPAARQSIATTRLDPVPFSADIPLSDNVRQAYIARLQQALAENRRLPVPGGDLPAGSSVAATVSLAALSREQAVLEVVVVVADRATATDAGNRSRLPPGILWYCVSHHIIDTAGLDSREPYGSPAAQNAFGRMVDSAIHALEKSF